MEPTTPHKPTPPLTPARLRQARRAVAEGASASAALDGGDPDLRRSWERSQAAGLSPLGRTPGTPHASAVQLAQARAREHELIAHARPALEFLHEQTRDSDSLILLSDAQGMLLETLGDAAFAQRAERVALRPGANWHEQWRGTNAIGTALVEQRPVVVHGGEHYLERNGFLTCAAAPIIDPAGQLLGVIDISSDHRQFHRHTLGLVRSAVRMVEHRLFETRHRDSLRLRLHKYREGLVGLTEGLVALSEDGWLIGANMTALHLLGLARDDIAGLRLEALFDMTMARLRSTAPARLAWPAQWQRHDGTMLWVQVEAGREDIDVAPAPAPVATDTVRGIVEACGGNLSEAARRLGISRTTLYRRLQR